MSKRTYSTRSKSNIVHNDLSQAVDEVLHKYCKFESEFTFFTPMRENFTDENKINEEQKFMKPINTVLNEMNSDLWDRAFTTSLADISDTFFPHYIVVQKLINYVLNSEFLDIGLAKTFFTKLIFFHPPNTHGLQNYYWNILNDKYVTLNNVCKEDEGIFWCAVEALTSCLESSECVTDIPEYCYDKELTNAKAELFGLAESLNKKEGGTNSNQKSQICFESLSSTVKFQRVLIILEHLYQILEADFLCRMRADNTRANNRCFLSVLLWEKTSETGATTFKVRKLIHVYKLMEGSAPYHVGQVHRKLLKLLAEIVRLSDRSNNLYPFLGNNSNKFASDLSVKFIEGLTDSYKPENVTVVRMLRPHWLRLLVCSKLLSYITGRLCSPELSTAYDILKGVESMNTRRRNSKTSSLNKSQETRKQQSKEDSDNFNLGTEHCYSGCSLKQRKRKRLSEMDFNALDDKGWAVLHRAVLLGHEKCVENLLNYQPKNKKDKRIPNGRLKGFKNFTPLMCAVIKEQENICRLLLEHFGSELLEDFDVNGNSPLDMCQDKDIRKLMKSFERAKVSPGNRKQFYLTSDDKLLVTELCVQLVESYFITHRTGDVLMHSKNRTSTSDDFDFKKSENSVRCDYVRYENDVNINIKKLSELVNTFIDGKDIKKSLESLNLILNCTLGLG